MKNIESFKQFNLTNEFLSCLEEEEKLKKLVGDNPVKASNDTMGKLHELLVGKYLNNNSHMAAYPDQKGDSPEIAHDILKSFTHPKEYDRLNKRAAASAEDIKKRVEVNGFKIHHVHWTSQPGNIKSSTGVESAQTGPNGDASDIMLSLHKKIPKNVTKDSGGLLSGNQQKFHGVSLKVSDTSRHPSAINAGNASTYGIGDEEQKKHRKDIIKNFPELIGGNAGFRKQLLKSNPRLQEFMKIRNKKTKENVANRLTTKLNSFSRNDMVNHLKTFVLQAHKTPLQKAGHEHTRHTTFTTKGGYGTHEFSAIDPSKHWEPIFKGNEKIKAKTSGSLINFYHGDGKNEKKFATHSIKFKSESDPMSALGTTGKATEQ